MKAWDSMVRGHVWCHEFFMDTVRLMSDQYGVYITIMFVWNVVLGISLLSAGSLVGVFPLACIVALVWLILWTTVQYRRDRE